MKKLSLSALLAIGICQFALAQEGKFGGVEKSMDREAYEKAGLSKLSPEERAALDAYIRDYVAGKQKDAAKAAAEEAVDRAVKEHKVQPPSIIQSRIVGSFNGYGIRTTFPLENGEVWKPANADEVYTHAPLQNPAVIIFRDMFGYKMFVEGASMVRVKRVRED